MVAKGWGIVRPDLGAGMFKIMILGLIYVVLASLSDIFAIVAVEDVSKVSKNVEQEILDMTLLLLLLVVVVNGIFLFWIIYSVNSTVAYLRNMKQSSKLNRHLKLRCLMITSMLYSLGWIALYVGDKMMGILKTDQMWMMQGLMHINFLFLLTGVAILWRPNANAREYAMQMEIPTNGYDDGFETGFDQFDDENDLELSCVVPSAGDYNNARDFS